MVTKTGLIAVAGAASLSFAIGSTAVESAQFGAADTGREAPAAGHGVSGFRPLASKRLAAPRAGVFTWEKGLSGTHRYIVRFADEPLASYRGGIDGLAATNPDTLRASARSAAAVTAKPGSVKLDTASAASIAYLEYLDSRHGTFRIRLGRAIGQAPVIGRYRHAFNGMTVQLTQQQAARVASMPGVSAVQRDREHELRTANSVALIGAGQVWDGSATGGLQARGEGVVIGIIDTGINTDHPAFAQVSPGDGYVHVNPLGDGVFLRDCAPFDPVDNPNGGRPELCNNKLIGAYALSGGSAEDSGGHGSHLSGIAGGNLVPDVPLVALDGNPTGIVFDQLAGVAPRANIVAYRVCGQDACSSSNLLAAIDAAVADGVDVINYSIGSGPLDPWSAPTSLALLGARDAGIFVATAGSSDGPAPGTVGSPGISPWLTSVAASTHDRVFSEKLLADLAGGDTAPPGDIPGRAATLGYGPAPIVYAGDFGDPLCALNAFPPGTFAGEIVLCDRGGFALVDKAQSVSAGGAGALVIASTNTSGQTLFDTPFGLPSIMIGPANGDSVRLWLASGTGHTGRITAAAPVVDPDLADVVAGFSGRGPNSLAPDVVTPSVAAPGVEIYAPYVAPGEYALLSGTSISSAHVAGAAALLRQLHPDWSPAEIHSALASTGERDMTRAEDGQPATPFDSGGGRVQLADAVNAGLVMHETTAGFQAADPAAGGNPGMLNLPSFANGACLQTCTWQRTVRATDSGSWTVTSESEAGLAIDVSPSVFTLSEGETQTITVTADVPGLAFDEWVFGWVHLTPDAAHIAPQALPVAVAPTAGFLPERVAIDARRDAGSQLVGGFRTSELTGLKIGAFGLAAPDERVVRIEGDNGGVFSPYVSAGVGIEFYDVAAGSVLFSARTSDSTAPDVDLFVGRDHNGDGLISPDEELCQSGNPDDNELCELSGDVVSQGGVFWVAVTNFESSGAPSDDTVLTVVAAEPATGGFSATAPAGVQAGDDWAIRVFWDQQLQVGQTLAGALEVTAAGSSLAVIPVELTRLDDDVRIGASATDIDVGDVVDMLIEVEANLSPQDLTYAIDAQIPAGFELVPGSPVAGRGDVDVFGDMLIWTLTNPSLAGAPGNYVPSINGPGVDTSDPLYDPACDTGFGGYVDLELFGIDADPAISGDSVAFLTLAGQELPFYDLPKNGFTITDDGFGFFDSGTGPTPWVNTSIPDQAEPNDLVALAWLDLEIVYDADLNSGVTVTAPGPNLSVVEFDDMQPWPAGSTSDRIDFEVIFNGEIDDGPGRFEIVAAYDNVVGDFSAATVGVENLTGTIGTRYAGALDDGLMICYDYAGPDLSPTTLTYRMRATAAGEIVHVVSNVVDNPGSREAFAQVVFEVDADTDGDSVADSADNCTDVVNPGQEDFNGDSIGDICDADVEGPGGDSDEDCLVDFLDLQRVEDAFFSDPGSPAWDPEVDFDGSSRIDFSDLQIMRNQFFALPGPSAAGCH